MSVEFEASLEVAATGLHVAQLHELPGCYALAPAREAALDALVSRIPEYYAWLMRHDEYTPIESGPFSVRVVEAYRLGQGQPAGAFFASDAEPISEEDLDWFLALLQWTYEDIAALAPAPAYAAMVPRLAQMQVWLLTRLGFHTAGEDAPIGDATSLRRFAGVVLGALRGATDDQLVLIHDVDGERWSLRKVLRRSVLSARMCLDALADMRVS